MSCRSTAQGTSNGLPWAVVQQATLAHAVDYIITIENPTSFVSREMGGGHNQGELCTNVIGTLRGEHPQDQFSVVTKGEHTNNHCSPFNCPQYVYACTIHVKTDPV